MTTAQQREAAHHNSAAAPEQKGIHRAAEVEATGAGNPLAGPEALTPIQPRAPPSRMLRMPEVMARTGLSRTTLWRRMRAGTFPAATSLGENSIGWPESVITEWLSSRPMVRYAPGHEASAA